jgi:cyclic pyranopterin phosphate synthase
MVDVTPKEPTHRRALARGRVHMTTETTSLVARGAVNKGDVLAVARVAGIQAAKRAPDLRVWRWRRSPRARSPA